MKKRTIFPFVCLILLPALSFGQKLKSVTARPLKPLNMAAFNTPLSNAVTRQSFLQLLHSNQVAQLSEMEQTLLLAYKFVEETHQLPRTAISVRSKILPPEEYTSVQQVEINLGNRIRKAIQNPNTPTEIKRELLELQYAFSPHYKAVHVLENLNDWLTIHNTWPRTTIKHEGVLSPQEEYEINLAKSAQQLIAISHALSDDLVAQINAVRSYYDPKYISPAQRADIAQEKSLNKQKKSRLEEIRRAEWERYFSSDNPISTVSVRFYDSDDLPLDPATGHVLPTPDLLETPAFGTLPSNITPDFVYIPLINLLHWLEEHPAAWPSKRSRDPKTLQLIEDLEQITQYPEAQKELIKIYKQQFGLGEFWTPQSSNPTQLLRQLRRWLSVHNRWPRTDFDGLHKIYPMEHYSVKDSDLFPQKNFAELVLARRIYEYIDHLPFKVNSWQPKVEIMLEQDHPYYDNPELEQFRRLYQQYHK